MSHLPVNHHLRPLYRVLAALCGIYVIAFGVGVFGHSDGVGFFDRDGLPTVLGLRGNPALALLSIVAGVVLIAGAFVGGRLDQWVNLVSGLVFLTTGMLMMSVMRTSLNLLGFTMTTCIASFLIGLVLFAAGLYGQVLPRARAVRAEPMRPGQRPRPGPRARPRTRPRARPL